MSGTAAMPGHDNERPAAELGFDDGERLPWLESADDYQEEKRGNLGRIMGLVLLGLGVLALLIGGWYRLNNRDAAAAGDGDGSLIAAPEGDYKVAPEDPQGKTFEGTGDSSFAASEGQQADGRLAEAPLPPKTAPAASPSAAPGAGAPAAGAPAAAAPAAPAATGFAVQLGAFSRPEQAEAAWGRLVGRHEILKGLGKTVTEARVDIGTVHRLRAVVPDRATAANVCRQLQSAGAACQVIG